ncbi:ABC transporter substrate-binding protein [Telmatospirillum sp.]|uniref:MlaC/ttg2D family ABC transporter substrate-binding protein n=1 Tax=Telmatospirillum sp. TaxID=2079197 RepID=UPI00283BEC7E|nr:ABC transporter substrate-binding protein [Telmatospirillum sp.]MDR3436950.1 ABC transporter substrate-binding protein [Telmatospirillum sp.]
MQELAQTALATVAASNISANERSDRFRRLFVSAFDIPELGKFTLVRHWKTATPVQQTTFLKEFEDTQVLTWALRFKNYKGERVDTRGVTREGQATWLVDSLIIRPPSSPVSVQWRVHRATDGSLRVVDIISVGVSMAQTFRADYASVLQSNGGNIDGLLSKISAKNEQLAAAP